jgi:hypothetical protein
MGAGVAQIGERVQICRMPSRFIGEGQGRAKSYNEHKYGAMSCSFHGLLEGLSAEMNFLDVNPDLQVLTRRILRGAPNDKKLRQGMSPANPCGNGGCVSDSFTRHEMVASFLEWA